MHIYKINLPKKCTVCNVYASLFCHAKETWLNQRHPTRQCGEWCAWWMAPVAASWWPFIPHHLSSHTDVEDADCLHCLFSSPLCWAVFSSPIYRHDLWHRTNKRETGQFAYSACTAVSWLCFPGLYDNGNKGMPLIHFGGLSQDTRMNNTGQEGLHASHPMQLSATGPEGTAPGLTVLSPGPFISGNWGLSGWISSLQVCRNRWEPGPGASDCFSPMEFIFIIEMLHNLVIEHWIGDSGNLDFVRTLLP